jgi:hypothetical protein
MIVFRGCGKCEGDLYVERSLGDAELVCLQCGFRRTVNIELLERAERRTVERELMPATR